MNIALVPRTPQILHNPVKMNEVAAAAAAIQKQVFVHFAPIWKMNAAIGWAPMYPPAGVIPVFIDDIIPGVGSSIPGYHVTNQGHPYAEVRFGPTWTLTASHEILELIANADGAQFVPGFVPGIPGKPVRHLREVCDPCQDAHCGYWIDGFLVSDFCLPNYFGLPFAAPRFSYNNKIAAPFDVSPGGAQYWLDPVNNLYTRINVAGHYAINFLGKYGPLLPRQTFTAIKGDPYEKLSEAGGIKKLLAKAKAKRTAAVKKAKIEFDRIERDRAKLRASAGKARKLSKRKK